MDYPNSQAMSSRTNLPPLRLRRSSDDSSGSGSELDSAGPRLIRIDITSDPTCPFCLIGVRQLLIAIEMYNHQHPHAPIHPLIRMLPYQIFPRLNEEPMSRKAVWAVRFGEESGEKMAERVEEKMSEVGIESVQDGLISSPHLAHRLQTYALLRHPSHHLELCLDVFQAYHTTRNHPSDRALLSSLGVKHGLFETEQDALDWLEGDEYDLEVKKAYGVARRLGVTGVPFFVFQGRWAASGAMGVEEFVRLLHEIVKREAAAHLLPSPRSASDPNSAGSEEKRGRRLPENVGTKDGAVCEITEDGDGAICY